MGGVGFPHQGEALGFLLTRYSLEKITAII